MKIKDVMSRPVHSCERETNLAEVAKMMWDYDCGSIPVTTGDRKVVGIITDRDVCIAVATKHRKAEDIVAGEILNDKKNKIVFTCEPVTDIAYAMQEMLNHKVRRLPVVDEVGRLVGIVSIDDLIMAANDTKGKSPSYVEVIKTYESICRHPQVAVGV